ncbi:hypothetical protein CEXT_99421 [Caerostris extrusa]|uniref:Ycf15 n=1 Tax=Caerostris extrusa TaxID=172846 RepID=A0AAV4XGL5_CAEEX|nr:hypothetical protein CEXT_99421 [Caerostris extrusa]
MNRKVLKYWPDENFEFFVISHRSQSLLSPSKKGKDTAADKECQAKGRRSFGREWWESLSTVLPSTTTNFPSNSFESPPVHLTRKMFDFSFLPFFPRFRFLDSTEFLQDGGIYGPVNSGCF